MTCPRWSREKAVLKRMDTHWTKGEVKARHTHHRWVCTECGTGWQPPAGLPREPERKR